tara:strand:- start:429 stop:599 length:171 start_codon:yes stop_codon:yes gene_type:complete
MEHLVVNRSVFLSKIGEGKVENIQREEERQTLGGQDPPAPTRRDPVVMRKEGARQP